MDLGVIAIKRYTTFPRTGTAPHMQFIVLLRTLSNGGLTTLQEKQYPKLHHQGDVMEQFGRCKFSEISFIKKPNVYKINSALLCKKIQAIYTDLLSSV